MKISNSKKQLARIISENGGWRKGNYAIQDKDDKCVWFMFELKGRPNGRAFWPGVKSKRIKSAVLLPNWHQTILSRDEYFHLYPAPVKVVVENKTTCHLTVADKPTIEQLAADYRNLKDFADCKQQEADDAKADAEAKLAELVAAGKALGLVLGVEAPAQKYTGKFYNAKLGAPSHYGTGQGDEICEGCGRRFGNHVGVNCTNKPTKDQDHA